ncbi:hypothetical protein BN903_3 [Halorubrum sp. AJ67]|nr:hypothetical protein BN903_3 [Halorubrum sp. AJ67]
MMRRWRSKSFRDPAVRRGRRCDHRGPFTALRTPSTDRSIGFDRESDRGSYRRIVGVFGDDGPDRSKRVPGSDRALVPLAAANTRIFGRASGMRHRNGREC